MVTPCRNMFLCQSAWLVLARCLVTQPNAFTVFLHTSIMGQLLCICHLLACASTALSMNASSHRTLSTQK